MISKIISVFFLIYPDFGPGIVRVQTVEELYYNFIIYFSIILLQCKTISKTAAVFYLWHENSRTAKQVKDKRARSKLSWLSLFSRVILLS